MPPRLDYPESFDSVSPAQEAVITAIGAVTIEKMGAQTGAVNLGFGKHWLEYMPRVSALDEVRAVRDIANRTLEVQGLAGKVSLAAVKRFIAASKIQNQAIWHS